MIVEQRCHGLIILGLFVPMHFTTGFEPAWRFKEFTEEKDIPFWAISKEGETIEI